jgi:hypothetical protein
MVPLKKKANTIAAKSVPMGILTDMATVGTKAVIAKPKGDGFLVRSHPRDGY